jgi:hypothetical protein
MWGPSLQPCKLPQDEGSIPSLGRGDASTTRAYFIGHQCTRESNPFLVLGLLGFNYNVVIDLDYPPKLGNVSSRHLSVR